MILCQHVCPMQGFFDVRQSFAWKQIGCGETAPYILNCGVVRRVVTSCNPSLDMVWTDSRYSIPTRGVGFSVSFQVIDCRDVCVSVGDWTFFFQAGAGYCTELLCLTTFVPTQHHVAERMLTSVKSILHYQIWNFLYIQVLYDLTTHRLINSYRPFRGAWHYNLQSKNVGSTLLRYTAATM